jgi:hypothetical protein
MRCIILLAICFAQAAAAQQIELFCKENSNAADRMESPVIVNSNTGQMYGFPMFLAGACTEDFGKSAREYKALENQFSMTCHNKIASSFLYLSRVTGRLDITQIFHDKSNSKYERVLMCELKQKNKF